MEGFFIFCLAHFLFLPAIPARQRQRTSGSGQSAMTQDVRRPPHPPARPTRGACNPATFCAGRNSIFDGEPFSDFIDAFLQRIEAGVQASVVKVEKISDDEKSKNPVMRFHVDQNLVHGMPHRGYHAPQRIHCILPSAENASLIIKPAGFEVAAGRDCMTAAQRAIQTGFTKRQLLISAGTGRQGDIMISKVMAATLVVAVSAMGALAVTSTPARAQSDVEAEIIGFHQLCEKGDRRACVRFGILIGENRQRHADWRRAHADWWWWEKG
jgi:hypothetical protein